MNEGLRRRDLVDNGGWFQKGRLSVPLRPVVERNQFRSWLGDGNTLAHTVVDSANWTILQPCPVWRGYNYYDTDRSPAPTSACDLLWPARVLPL